MESRADELAREVETLRARLARQTEATKRITASLDFETVLQGVLDSARSLTGARYGLILVFDDSGALQHLLSSGLTPDEYERFLALPEGPALLSYLRREAGPRRFEDIHQYAASVGLADFRVPLLLEPPVTVLMAPIHDEETAVGNIYLTGAAPGATFQAEDEEALAMFASQAGMVLANARRYRDEQRARADLQTLVDTSPVGVVVLDTATGRPVLLNREARRITSELSRSVTRIEELLEIMTVRRADGREVSLRELPIAEALKAAEAVRLEEIVLEVPDGASVTTLVNATPIHSPAGAVTSVVVTMQDLRPLDEVAQLRAEFLAMVSHELRAPLAAIKGSAVTLLEADADLEAAERREFHRIIDAHAENMRGLIGALLDVARIQTGTLPVEPEPVTVAAIVDEARNRFRDSGGRENLHIDLPAGLPPVLADRRRIAQVLNNLLSNAAKFSPPNSPIRLAAHQRNLHVTISISDEGRGVAPEHLLRLFAKFSRIGSGAHGLEEGHGLGLAISKGIVEAHGGRIWADSDGPGLGTRVAFTVPVAQLEDIAPSAPTRRTGDDLDQPRILAVDDDPRALRHTRDALTQAGYTPIVTGDPDDVPRLLTANNPDLVLMDLMLPETDGIDLMRRILNLADLPIIFVSAFGQDDVIAHALDAGAVDYIVKPFSPAELAARIRVALRQHGPAHQAEPAEPYRRGDLTIHYPGRQVTLAGRCA